MKQRPKRKKNGVSLDLRLHGTDQDTFCPAKKKKEDREMSKKKKKGSNVNRGKLKTKE